ACASGSPTGSPGLRPRSRPRPTATATAPAEASPSRARRGRRSTAVPAVLRSRTRPQTRTRARARSGAGQGETSRLEVQPVMQLAPRVEPAAARGAAVPAVEVLPDGQHVAARAAQHRGRVEPLARPAFGRVRLEFRVAVVAGVELPAAGEADGDAAQRPAPGR